MDGRERTIRTVEFSKPDRIPREIWFHKATIQRYGGLLDELLQEFPQDIARLHGPMDRAFYDVSFTPGTFTDQWGSTWEVIQEGMIGEVKVPALTELEAVRDYALPVELLGPEWKKSGDIVRRKIDSARQAGQFVIGAQVELFQRMQFIRGTENLFYDIGDDSEHLVILRDKVLEYFHTYLDYWLREDVDAIAFYDDWGSQLSLLISPSAWKRLFKPAYEQLIGRILQADKRVFFHCDGYIVELYPEFIELGVHAINSQVWCMGLEQLAPFAGRITFWGEVDRQKTLAFGTPDDVFRLVQLMKEKLYRNGGLIGQSVAGVDVPLENIRALMESWNKT